MTKKDYELFASEIRLVNDLTPVEFDILVNITARVFKRDNPLFNEEKYRIACHTGKHIRKSIKERLGA